MNLENLSEISKKNIFEIRDSKSYKNSLSKFKFKKYYCHSDTIQQIIITFAQTLNLHNLKMQSKIFTIS